MIGLIQRVTTASVHVAGKEIANIGNGLLVLAAVVAQDEPADAQRLADRILNYRVFPDASGRMNLSLLDCDGEVLWVPQFTLAANTKRGRRPSFASAAAPEFAEKLFDTLVEFSRAATANTSKGEFGADMQVQLCNDGPVTFWLES